MMNEKTVSDNLNPNELMFLLGLAVKHEFDYTFPKEDIVTQSVKEIYSLFSKLHLIHQEFFFDRTEMDNIDASKIKNAHDLLKAMEKAFKNRSNSGQALVEPMFYGSNAMYDFQCIEFVPQKYRYDKEWFLNNKGFSLESAIEIINLIRQDYFAKLMAKEKPSKNYSEWLTQVSNLFSFSTEILKTVEHEHVNHFVKSFSLISGNANNHLTRPGQYNAVVSNPLVELPEDRYFLPYVFFLARSLYESPFYWMLDDDEYKATSFKNRGQATEDITFNLLKPIFGSQTYQGVRVQRKKSETASDIDILAVYKNKAIVVQAKSKRLTTKSTEGDTEQIKQDFDKSIQKAYDQGIVCRKEILESTSTFYNSEGKEILFKESINEVFIICILLDAYPALTTQLNIYLEKEEKMPYPIAIDVFDLTIMAYYLDKPIDFLYYIRQRINLMHSQKSSSELSNLGAYFRSKPIVPQKHEVIVTDNDSERIIAENYSDSLGHDFLPEKVPKLQISWKTNNVLKAEKFLFNEDAPDMVDKVFKLYDDLDPQIRRKRLAPKGRIFSRNSNCYCGSSKKYKRCCGKIGITK